MEKKERLTSDKWPATGWAGLEALTFMISANPSGNSLTATCPFSSAGKGPPCSGTLHSCLCTVFSCYLLPNSLLPDLTLVTPSLNGLFLCKKWEWSSLWWQWKDANVKIFQTKGVHWMAILLCAGSHKCCLARDWTLGSLPSHTLFLVLWTERAWQVLQHWVTVPAF